MSSSMAHGKGGEAGGGELGGVRRPLNVVFFGTDEFSVEHLRMLHDNSTMHVRAPRDALIGDIVVYCKGQRSHNRKMVPCAVKQFCQERGIPHTELVERDGGLREAWRKPRPLANGQPRFDVGVVVSFGLMVPKRTIEYFLDPSENDGARRGILNVHPSLLPVYRGANPIAHTIINDDPVTGVTVQRLSPGAFDAGQIIEQVPVRVPPMATLDSLTELLARRGATVLQAVLRNWNAKWDGAYDQLAVKGAPAAPKLSQLMFQVDWTALTAHDVHLRHRALRYLVTQFGGKRVKLLKLVPEDVPRPDISQMSLDTRMPPVPGSYVYRKGGEAMYIMCADGNWVGVKSLCFEAKRPVGAKDFMNSQAPRIQTLRVLTSMPTSLRPDNEELGKTNGGDNPLPEGSWGDTSDEAASNDPNPAPTHPSGQPLTTGNVDPKVLELFYRVKREREARLAAEQDPTETGVKEEASSTGPTGIHRAPARLRRAN